MEHLCKLYRIPISRMCTIIEMERYSMFRIYSEITSCLFREDYINAENKLELLRNYVDPDSEEIKLLSLIQLTIQQYQKDQAEQNSLIFELENILNCMVLPLADISKYPFRDIDLRAYLIYIEALENIKHYDAVIDLSEKLIQNLSHTCHNESIFCDYYSLLYFSLIKAFLYTKRYDDALSLSRKVISSVAKMSDISNTYLHMYLYVQILEQSGDHSISVRTECIEYLKKMYYLLLSCDMSNRADKVMKKLSQEYGISDF